MGRKSSRRKQTPESLLDLQLPDLPAELQRLMRQIPRGRVTTYGTLAAALGSSTAARWVGEYLVDHPHTDDCPCHRVVRKSGEPGLHVSGDPNVKRSKLQSEGVSLQGDRVPLREYGFDGFETREILQPLVRLQSQIREATRLEPYRAEPAVVGGLDVSYRRRRSAVAAYAVLDRTTGQVRESFTHCQDVTFPYIPGFLTFRESVIMAEVLHRARRRQQLTDVILVDGNGILHPRRAGLATCVGVATGCRTIGVGKSLLCGQVDLRPLRAGTRVPIHVEEQLVGYALQATDRSRPIYVSPGHRIDADNAARIVQSLFLGHRLPEPIYAADRLSRQTARDA